jgi:hypothetical protein
MSVTIFSGRRRVPPERPCRTRRPAPPKNQPGAWLAEVPLPSLGSANDFKEVDKSKTRKATTVSEASSPSRTKAGLASALSPCCPIDGRQVCYFGCRQATVARDACNGPTEVLSNKIFDLGDFDLVGEKRNDTLSWTG